MTSQYAACPKCGAANAEVLKFTWWGGALGPRLLSHVRCADCRHKYNGKTGGDNTVGILVYSLIAGAAAFLLMFVAFYFLKTL